MLVKHRGRKREGNNGEWARSERSEIQSQIARQKVEDGQVNVLSKNDNKFRGGEGTGPRPSRIPVPSGSMFGRREGESNL